MLNNNHYHLNSSILPKCAISTKNFYLSFLSVNWAYRQAFETKSPGPKSQLTNSRSRTDLMFYIWRRESFIYRMPVHQTLNIPSKLLWFISPFSLKKPKNFSWGLSFLLYKPALSRSLTAYLFSILHQNFLCRVEVNDSSSLSSRKAQCSHANNCQITFLSYICIKQEYITSTEVLIKTRYVALWKFGCIYH